MNKARGCGDEQYDREGYQIFRNALKPNVVRRSVDAIRNELFTSEQPLLRHPTGRVEQHRFVEAPENPPRRYISNAVLNPHQATALPETSAALLDLICSPELHRCLNQLDGSADYTIYQVILFFVGPCMDIHADAWFFDTFPHGYAHTVWIPLEETTIRNGPTCIYPWRRGHFVEAEELGLPGLFSERDDEALTRYHRYQDAILQRCRQQQSAVIVPQMAPGDFAVWASLTPHGTLPALREGMSRLSMQVLIRPSSMKWGSFQDLHVDRSPRHEVGTQVRSGWLLQ